MTVPNNLNIVQWNCTSLNDIKIVQLITCMQEYDIDVACFSETGWNQTFSHSLRTHGFYVYYKSRTHSRGGGVAIIVRENIASHAGTDLDAACEVIWVELFLQNNSHLLIAPCFFAPHNAKQIAVLSSALCALRENVFICGDSNAKRSVWDHLCRANNHTGNYVEKLIDTHNLIVLSNPYSPTYFHYYSGSRSVLDIKSDIEIDDEDAHE